MFVAVVYRECDRDVQAQSIVVALPSSSARSDRERRMRGPGYLLPGAKTSAFGTPHPPGSDSVSAGSLTTSCVERPPVKV
jgi:hypothetical protein